MIKKDAICETGLVFGVFDGLHQGHRYFLTEAKKRCRKLVVVVASPEIVYYFKKRLPLQSFEERAHALSLFDPTLTLVLGDTTPGAWSALKKYRPDMVFLGYDQTLLAEELQKISVPSTFLPAHEPRRYKSSLLRDGN